MTLPDERYRAVKYAEQLMIDIVKGEFPRTPKALREEAKRILRHYPTGWDMQLAAQKVPELFQEQMEPLYRMIKQHEQDKQNER